MPQGDGKTKSPTVKGRMRRKDIEEILGEVPAPEVKDGQYLIDILFQLGPFRGDLPLSEADLEPWERRREIELLPWQAELIVDMSKAYLGEMHSSREWSALCPWPKGRKMWKYVMDKKHERSTAEKRDKEKEPHGTGKRHRNPPAG